MKKLLAITFIFILAFSLTACFGGNENDQNLSDKLESLAQNAQSNKENTQTDAEVDYTPYADLVNTYFEKYGALIEELCYEGGEVNTAGFNYAELIDFNHDGVLELVLIGVSDELNTIEHGASAIDLYYDDLYLKDLIAIYTLSESGEALLLGTQTLSSYGNGGVDFGVEYAKSAEITYMLNSFRSDSETVTYYELLNDALVESLNYEKIYDYDTDSYSGTLNGESCEISTLNDTVSAKGEVEFHKISWLTEQELEQLITRNEKTFLFLEQYAPIHRAAENSSETSTSENKKPFEVSFVGYHQEMMENYGYEIPTFDKVLSSEEQARLAYFGTENGDEYYLIRSKWQSPIQIYETSLDDNYNPVRGKLLYETNSNLLYLQCNESELYSEVEVAATSPDGAEFSYYPLVSGFDGSAVLGETSREFDFIETAMQDIDYSPYSALLKAYTLDYNVVHTGPTDYSVKGMTLNPTSYAGATNDSIKDASGFCYANLVDLDHNGILELILVAYDLQEYDDFERYYEEQVLHVDELKYPNIVKIYTISPDYGLMFLGSLPLNHLQSPVTSHLGLEYSVSADKTYLVQSEMYQMGNGEIRYYGLTDDLFLEEAFFEIELKNDFVYHFKGKSYSQEEFEPIKNSYGVSEHHYITNIYDQYIEQLENINKATFDFLADYPVKNFESYSGTYHNGAFYFEEFVQYDYYPPFEPVVSYYKALTTHDYAVLEPLIGNEKTTLIKNEHTNGTPYVPGYIISDLWGYVALEAIEPAEMRQRVTDLTNEVQTEDNQFYVVRCIVNEVLDPHTVQLGLQFAGDLYEAYFVVSTTDPLSGQWKIEEIITDRF